MPRCDRCDRWFKNERALEQHKDDSSMHHICYDCNKDFTSNLALIQHFTQSPRHQYCRSCDEHFDDWDDLYDHYDEEHYYCRICNQVGWPSLCSSPSLTLLIASEGLRV